MSEQPIFEHEPGKEPGLISSEIEYDHHVLRLRWADGEENVTRFPTWGIPVVEPDTQKPLGRISGTDAVDILTRECLTKKRSEFRWSDYVGHH